MLMRAASSLSVNMKFSSPVPLGLLNLTTRPKEREALRSECIKHDGFGLAKKQRAGSETGFALLGGKKNF